MAALRLVQEGKLSLDSDVNQALTSWKIPPSAAAPGAVVTLRSHRGAHGQGFPGYAAGAPIFQHKPRKPTFAGLDRDPAAMPQSSVPPPRTGSGALSAVLPSLPSNASVFDVPTHRVSTRVAGAGDEAVDAAVHLMRTGSRSVLFGTLAVVALVGVLLGRHR